MDCIKDFLDDSYQAKLRKFAQGLSERHEDTIDSYRKLFITHYNYVKYGNEKCKECPFKSIINYFRLIFS